MGRTHPHASVPPRMDESLFQPRATGTASGPPEAGTALAQGGSLGTPPRRRPGKSMLGARRPINACVLHGASARPCVQQQGHGQLHLGRFIWERRLLQSLWRGAALALGRDAWSHRALSPAARLLATERMQGKWLTAAGFRRFPATRHPRWAPLSPQHDRSVCGSVSRVVTATTPLSRSRPPPSTVGCAVCAPRASKDVAPLC